MSLAYKLRPQTLKEFIGQEHLVGKNGIIRKMLEKKNLFSMIFWGPPGCGKTTLANIIANSTNSDFYFLSGVSSGKKDLQKVIAMARANKKYGKKTILFVDEVHRWNKAQQDSLLPHVETGLIVFIGATTENPSFEVISPLLSRSRVFVLYPLSAKELESILKKALTDKKIGLGKYKKQLDEPAKELLLRLSGGDARIMLNALEIAVTNYKDTTITLELIKDIFQTKSTGIYDKRADEHYNTISAFIKSMRASDPDATLYYLMRMLEAGEDPKFIARRMIIFASEDIGLADRGALIQANAAFEAVDKVGLPEAKLILSHIALYLALAKKSRATVNAMQKALNSVFNYPSEPIPLHLRNAPTPLMKNLGYAKNYQWSENYVGPSKKVSLLPEKLKNKKFYKP